MEFFDVIKNRRSIRNWVDKEISEDLLRKIIDAARWAPSSCNRQPCKFLVVKNKKHRKILGGFTPSGKSFCHKAPILMLVLFDKRLYNDKESPQTPYLDTAAAIENLLLAAYYLGLGACWLNFDVKVLGCEKKVFSIFNIPEYLVPVSLIALGYKKKNPGPPLRKEIDSFIIYEKFEGKHV